jgi:hypothetical protein
LALDWNRDAFTRGNFCPRGEILKSRRDSPQNTRVAFGEAEYSAFPNENNGQIGETTVVRPMTG